MLSLFKSKPLLDEQAQNWIVDTLVWAIERFDTAFFIEHTQIILPTNKYFPDQVQSIEAMSQSVFKHVIKYAGMQNWPIKLMQPAEFKQSPFPEFGFADYSRGEKASVLMKSAPGSMIHMSYNPQQINQPQDLVASFAQTLAMILIHQGRELPPGGEAFLPQASEVVASFLGFGVMISNTAYQFKGGCGTCYNAHANRQSALPEIEVIFSLALVAKLQGCKKSLILSHLKPHLKSIYNKADKEITNMLKETASPVLLALTDKKQKSTLIQGV